MTHILVVEDEERIGQFFSKGLKAAGYAVSYVRTARDCLDYLRAGGIDLVILDLGLPDEDGMAVLARLRAQDPRLPVIIVTARSSVVDTVAGLDGGADDYLAKPVRLDELLARIRARLKKTDQPQPSCVLTVGRLTLDPQTRRVKVDDRDVDLSAREFSLLETLLRNADQVLSRERLLTRVWGYDYDPDSNIVDVYVGDLRRKLGAEVIETIRGVGFRLSQDVEHRCGAGDPEIAISAGQHPWTNRDRVPADDRAAATATCRNGDVHGGGTSRHWRTQRSPPRWRL